MRAGETKGESVINLPSNLAIERSASSGVNLLSYTKRGRRQNLESHFASAGLQMLTSKGQFRQSGRPVSQHSIFSSHKTSTRLAASTAMVWCLGCLAQERAKKLIKKLRSCVFPKMAWKTLWKITVFINVQSPALEECWTSV